ncbi:MAG: type II toxin-antitoxin system VapC family toxin [Thermoplasmatota archaeon]
MPVFVDTGPLVAFLSADDSEHDRARSLMRRVLGGELGTALTSDWVIVESLTYLRRRPARVEVSRALLDLVHGPRAPLRVRTSDASRMDEAIRIHFELYERGLSLVDCGLVALAREAKGVVGSFDRRFDGVIPRVDGRAPS